MTSDELAQRKMFAGLAMGVKKSLGPSLSLELLWLVFHSICREALNVYAFGQQYLSEIKRQAKANEKTKEKPAKAKKNNGKQTRTGKCIEKTPETMDKLASTRKEGKPKKTWHNKSKANKTIEKPA